MSVHLNEGKSAVRLEAGFGDITKVLEKRHKVRLRSVRSEVADVACGLPLRSLCNDHIVALHAMGGEMMVSEGSGRRHTHGSHGLLLGNGRLSFLVGPVAADSARAKPLSVHRAESAISIGAIPKRDKSVTTRPARLHVPHNASLGNGTKGGESLEENLIIDFVGQVTDKDMEMVRGVFFGCVVRLVGPVNTNFLHLLASPT